MKKNIKKEENKKLYKNWKLYATALAIALIGAGTGLGIYYGTTNHSEVTKIDLSTLNIEKTISGKENMSEQDAFDKFLNVNENFSELKNNIESITFVKPTYTNDGSLVINAKTNSKKYTGTITITISKLEQINLSNLKLNTILTIPVVSQQAAFDLFIKSNLNIIDLKENIEIVNYIASDYNKLGSLVINAKTNSKKYTGTITITIPEKNKTNLNMLISNTTIQGKETMTEQDAFNVLLEANNSWSNLSDFVEYSSYKAATYTTDGSLVINAKANTMFTGNITVKINAIKQTKLSNLKLKTTIIGVQNITEEEAFNAFLEANKDILDENLTLDQVELSNFQTIGVLQNGTLTITVKEGINSKYTGSINIKFKYILDETKFSDIVRYLSNNHLLNFQITTGAIYSGTNNVFAQITEQFISSMGQYYQLANNILSISIVGASEKPTQDELNTKDYLWTRETLAWINLRVIYNDGKATQYIGAWNVQNVTITMI